MNNLDQNMIVFENPVKTFTKFIRYKLKSKGLLEVIADGLRKDGKSMLDRPNCESATPFVAGECAAKSIADAAEPHPDVHRPVIEERKGMIDQVLGRQNGPDWEETLVALQQCMVDYAGHVRNESLLKQRLSHLRRVKEKALTMIMARNAHELGRCLEVLNLLDLGEITFLMALDRKETRGLHVRPDYPFTNPTLNQAHVIARSKGQNAIQWRPY